MSMILLKADIFGVDISNVSGEKRGITIGGVA